MIALIVSALLADVPAAAPQPTPMREVVYKVSSIRHEDLAIGTYGGRVAMGDTPNIGTSNPTSKQNATLEEGRLEVDVLGIQQGVMRVSVTESFNSRSSPLTYGAYITSNGLVRFERLDASVIARYLLPLFATKFLAAQTFNPGDAWHVDLKTDAVDVQNIFTISGQDGALLLLDERETVKLNTAHGMNYTTYGKLKYKPSMLVPITGDINEKGARSTMDTVDTLETTVHFERVSDSLDTAPTITK